MAQKRDIKVVGADVIQVYSGRLVDIGSFGCADVNLGDIGHALANLCRFGGHAKEFYSVAQHSYMVEKTVAASLADPDSVGSIQMRMMALLHDAHEAYLGDIVRPLQGRFRKLPLLVERIDASIATALGVWRWHLRDAEDQEMIRIADNAVLMGEKRDHLNMPDVVWPSTHGEPIEERTEAWRPSVAKEAFIERWLYLCRLQCGAAKARDS